MKDAEFNPTARQGVYGGYQSWVDRAGRFRSLGDGQVNFSGIFSYEAKVIELLQHEMARVVEDLATRMVADAG